MEQETAMETSPNMFSFGSSRRSSSKPATPPAPAKKEQTSKPAPKKPAASGQQSKAPNMPFNMLEFTQNVAHQVAAIIKADAVPFKPEFEEPTKTTMTIEPTTNYAPKHGSVPANVNLLSRALEKNYAIMQEMVRRISTIEEFDYSEVEKMTELTEEGLLAHRVDLLVKRAEDHNHLLEAIMQHFSSSMCI
jgi:hypothetical protein